MTAKKCRGTNKDGSPCDAYALNGSDYCFHHDPDCAAERRAARSKGWRARHGRHIGPVGQSKPITLDTAADVTALIKRTIDDGLSEVPAWEWLAACRAPLKTCQVLVAVNGFLLQ